MSALSDIERDLKALLRTNRKAWVESFRMMEKVKREALWSPSYRSFSSWLTMISEETRIHVSVLWERLQAGEFYLRYAREEGKAGREVPELEHAGVGVEKLKYILRIASGDTTRAKPLIEKARNGELTGAALRESWKTEKADRLARGEKIGFLNGYDREKIYADQKAGVNPPKSKETAPIPTSEFLMALASDCVWLSGSTLSPVYAEAYEVFPEVTLVAGTLSELKIEAIAVESLTQKQTPGHLALHGIVIANSAVAIDALAEEEGRKRLYLLKSYTDFLWILVPESLESLAEARAADEQIGILALTKENGRLVPALSATQLAPAKRGATLEVLLFRSVKKVRSTPKAVSA